MAMQHSVNFEIKSIGPREFEGYGSIFGNADLGGDIVVPGAFRESLRAHKAAGTLPMMFWMHDPTQVPGVWLDMDEHKRGLYVRGEIVDTVLGRDVRTLLDKKAVRGLSIGYQPTQSDWDQSGHRLLKQVDLHEVSIVSMAMNPLAQIEALKARLSAHGEYVPTLREVENRLRTAGFSKSMTRRIGEYLFDSENAGGMPGEPRRDADEVEVDPETKDVLAALRMLTDKVGAQALKRY